MNYDKEKEAYDEYKSIEMDYPAAARAIALWLNDYCKEELKYPNMIAYAAMLASKEISELKEEKERLKVCGNCTWWSLSNSNGHCRYRNVQQLSRYGYCKNWDDTDQALKEKE